MEYIHYEDIASFDEDALDCLSLDALFAEFLIEEELELAPLPEDETGLAPCWGDE